MNDKHNLIIGYLLILIALLVFTICLSFIWMDLDSEKEKTNILSEEIERLKKDREFLLKELESHVKFYSNCDLEED